MENLARTLNAAFAAQPGLFLAAGLLLLAVLLVLGLWLVLRQGRVRQQTLERLLTEAAAREAERDQAARELLRREFQSLNAVRQQHLQNAQSRLEERVGNVETALLRQQGVLRVELLERFEKQHQAVSEDLGQARTQQQQSLAELRQQLEQGMARHRESFGELQRKANADQLRALVESLESMNKQVQESFRTVSGELGKRVEQLTRTTDARLKEISGQVEKRLADGFEKTTETFTRVLEHLSRIDEAQKKITELSGNVVSLQEVLTDKRSRGAFGEVQLEGLVRNIMPEGSYEMQATLSNGKRVDCLLRLPDPTGNVPIDAKFPLESYQRMQDFDLPEPERASAATRFKRDIRKHIDDIAGKYLIQGETADGAVMFIPAEAVFAEIHAHFPELVERAQQARVWMVSPTTLMAVLTTARAVLKDDATRRQIHVIQEYLAKLAEDFKRFKKRMGDVARLIERANKEVEKVHISSRKITDHFERIEQVEIEPEDGEDAPPGLPR